MTRLAVAIGGRAPRGTLEAEANGGIVVTLLQLEAEPYWDREVVTPDLAWLGAQLCARTGRPPAAFGAKGSTSHLSGGHRSQEWIKGSAYCVDRWYTVQPNLSATQLRHVAACDWTPGVWGTGTNRRMVIGLTNRLVNAGKAGHLGGVTEIIGSFDGVRAVGTTVATGGRWPADDTHLDHVHLTFDRHRLADRAVMERILAVALGEDNDVSQADVIAALKSDDGRKELQAAALGGVLTLLQQASTRSTPAGRQACDYLRAVVAGATPTHDVWQTVVGYDGVIPTPPDWPNPANTHLALASALSELLARAVAGEGLPQAVGQLTALVETGGGDPDVAALVAKLDQVAAAVAGLRTELADVRTRVAGALGGGG